MPPNPPNPPNPDNDPNPPPACCPKLLKELPISATLAAVSGALDAPSVIIDEIKFLKFLTNYIEMQLPGKVLRIACKEVVSML